MLIRCFGVDTSFDYHQIGGTDSYFRRLGEELCRREHQVEFIHYGCPQDERSQPGPSFRIKKFRSFRDALDELAGSGGPILVNAVKAKDRLQFIRFRHRMRRRLDFYMVYSLFAHTRVGRIKHFLEAMLYPYRPGTICMSRRLAEYVKTIRNRAETLLPPVPVGYFAKPEEKGRRDKLVVGYIGRLENGKGAPEAIELIEALSHRDDIELRVSGYSFNGTPGSRHLAGRLARNENIIYKKRNHQGWTPELEKQLALDLRDIDVLLLPYRRIASSIDTPLLLLEGMAGLCCCVTPPQGDIPRIYGDSPFLISGDNFVRQAHDLLTNGIRSLIDKEKKRIHSRIQQLRVDTPSSTDRLLEIIQKG